MATVTVTTGRRGRRTGGRQHVGFWSALFLSPTILVIGLFTVIPLIITVVISFTDWSVFRALGDWKFVGLRNYEALLANTTRLQAIWNTVAYVVLSVVFTVPLAALVAMLLYFPKLKGAGFVRVALFATYVIPTIAVVIVWGNLYAPGYGPFSAIFTAVGLPSPGWLSDPRIALFSVVIFNVWQMLGYYVILITAGLTQIPEELYEAAKIDGAGIFRQTWSVTVPLLRPTLLFVLLMTVVNSIQVFDPIYLLTRGGPANATNVLSYEIQRAAFEYGKAGDAAALSVSLLMIVVLVGAIAVIVVRRRK
ncbi:MAG: sugar ABC transporter permease [Microbacterium sp.]|uniref:carbohydrate ABC transporter permease n=1 Tax=Microbacterium sp. TaxID=51671 RepID=UPI001ACBF495|nr:sugar ABC transporter permease [Microbacterium sp.]MBN9177492.1 sugar ABC transporter permease [Microbacterium sp.]